MTKTAAKATPRARTSKKTLAPVLVTMVLDRSGSMGVCREETIEAFNTYVEQLRKDKGETFVTLRLFDNEHDVVYRAMPVAEVPTLTLNDYVPRAATALNDAIARGVADADTAKVKAGTKHLLVVVTDGHENASCEHSSDSIKRLIDEREERGWTVVFLQANLNLQAAQGIAFNYGVSKGNVAVYDTQVVGSTSAMMASMSAVTRTHALTEIGATMDCAFASAGESQDHRTPTVKK